MQPTNVAWVAVGAGRGSGRTVVDAVREGRTAMRAKEAELREKPRRREGSHGQPEPRAAGARRSWSSTHAVGARRPTEFRAATLEAARRGADARR